jgi:hypothetical protein
MRTRKRPWGSSFGITVELPGHNTGSFCGIPRISEIRPFSSRANREQVASKPIPRRFASASLGPGRLANRSCASGLHVEADVAATVLRNLMRSFPFRGHIISCGSLKIAALLTYGKACESSLVLRQRPKRCNLESLIDRSIPVRINADRVMSLTEPGGPSTGRYDGGSASGRPWEALT